MPNAPKTKVRGVRIPDELWADAQAMAADEGTDVSVYVRDDLAKRVRRWRKRRPSADELLGIAPDWTGGLSVDEYMDQQRRR